MENFNLIISNIERHISLTDEQKTDFQSLVFERIYHKGQLLLRAGETCTNFAFVDKGCVKSYLIDEKGFEHILTIAVRDWWIADIRSYVTGTPGNLWIEAIENTKAIVLSRHNQEILFRKHPDFERYFRILTERGFAVSQQRIVERMSLSAEERFEKFIHQYPALLHQLSHQQIASYIDVTPSFFSRMLKKRKLK
ncbi:Crp/Fnr family transcriptional regulator [Pedobacter caeni]|uniref:cAMP-binding domain of CRP or a regulatory subunit of cAMP-dependent protein kinases n=1 Tax=Pedobacter caeni TaxID=288992 RepID=A0A1M5M028_9SPHI|nr:Crp/Fnr family transcriptional regulator [Pedobacter caeni]SHG70692.1 cAMP-binding domain of CRP or a regulatory subunit of cAMP-dependent protein kinases [Pedobacter caeni]